MRNIDLGSLTRFGVGFDRLVDLINNTRAFDASDNYPPYDIVRTGDETFRISLAVAGFAPDAITVTAEQNLVTVAGRAPETANEGRQYLYHGIAHRPFQHRFSLADYVEVEGATHENGLIHIDLRRRVPDAVKPRRIEIASHGNARAMQSMKAA